MGKKYWIAAAVAFVAVFILDWVIHGLILAADYEAMGAVRPEGQMIWWGLILGEIFFALAFTWIYAKGYERDKVPLGQGFRYGLAIGVLHAASPAFINYGVAPITMGATLKWTILGLVEFAIIGILVATIFGRGEAAAAAPGQAPVM